MMLTMNSICNTLTVLSYNMQLSSIKSYGEGIFVKDNPLIIKKQQHKNNKDSVDNIIWNTVCWKLIQTLNRCLKGVLFLLNQYNLSSYSHYVFDTLLDNPQTRQ